MVTQTALTFPCDGETLVGVVTQPAVPASVGVVIVVGGPQYRAGSHRQFVLLARRLASAGIATLRFDYRGMGDATGIMRSFEHTSADLDAAIAAFQRACPGIARVVLWGLCDAASAALLHVEATGDHRVAGLALVNPWVRSQASMAKTELKHYYAQRILDGDFWAKLVRGKIDVAAAVGGVATRLVAAQSEPAREAASTGTFQDRMADGLRRFEGPVLLLLSGRDLTAKEFVEYTVADARWQGLLARGNIERRDIAPADHTFSSAQWRAEAEMHTLAWLTRTLAPELQ